jgi:hypothetical protein
MIFKWKLNIHFDMAIINFLNIYFTNRVSKIKKSPCSINYLLILAIVLVLATCF